MIVLPSFTFNSFLVLGIFDIESEGRYSGVWIWNYFVGKIKYPDMSIYGPVLLDNRHYYWMGISFSNIFLGLRLKRGNI